VIGMLAVRARCVEAHGEMKGGLGDNHDICKTKRRLPVNRTIDSRPQERIYGKGRGVDKIECSLQAKKSHWNQIRGGGCITS